MPSKRKPNEPLDELRHARLLETRERIKRLRRENQWGAGQMILKKDHDKLMGRLGTLVKMTLYAKMENELPVHLEGQDVVAIRRKLRDAADAILDTLHDTIETYVYETPPRMPDSADAIRGTTRNEDEN